MSNFVFIKTDVLASDASDELNIVETNVSSQNIDVINVIDRIGTGNYKRLSLQKDSTETDKMNRLFEHYLHMFQKNESSFLYCLSHSSFADGMNNEAANVMKSYFELSPYPAISWFATLFNDHIKDSNISFRLLRCLCDSSYRKYSRNLISFVRGALNDKNVEVQEAAFMVLENWRTKECLDVIENTKYVNPLLETYASSLKEELKEELC